MSGTFAVKKRPRAVRSKTGREFHDALFDKGMDLFDKKDLLRISEVFFNQFFRQGPDGAEIQDSNLVLHSQDTDRFHGIEKRGPATDDQQVRCFRTEVPVKG